MINNLYPFFSSIYALFNGLWRSLAFSVFTLRKLSVPVEYLIKTAVKIKSKSTNKRATDILAAKRCWIHKIHCNMFETLGEVNIMTQLILKLNSVDSKANELTHKYCSYCNSEKLFHFPVWLGINY